MAFMFNIDSLPDHGQFVFIKGRILKGFMQLLVCLKNNWRFRHYRMKIGNHPECFNGVFQERFAVSWGGINSVEGESGQNGNPYS